MIILPTDDAEGLLAGMKEAIDRHRIKTWSYDDDGDFTHTAEQWNQLAWLRPDPSPSGLHLFIIAPTNTPVSRATYAVYHGRFIEMALRHFDGRLTASAQATPLPAGDDVIG